MALIESVRQRVHLPLPLWERSYRIADAIRVRGYALSMDRNPSPQPSPTRGEGGALPLPLQINLISSCSRLERFRTEQTPFRVKKTRQNKRPERVPIQSDPSKAPVGPHRTGAIAGSYSGWSSTN